MNFLEGNFGIEIVEFFQSGIFGKSLYYILFPFHYLGSEMGYLVLLPLIYWSINKELGKQLFIFVLLSTVFTNLLKNAWQRPRPFHVSPDRIHPIEYTTEFGLPSGHTIFGTILGLSFLKNSKNNWQILASILLILLMGISRLVDGMHFLQDIILGWLLGWLFFSVFYKSKKLVLRKFNSISLSQKITTLFIIALVAFTVLALTSSDFEFNKSLLSPLGGLWGGVIGIFIESEFIQFRNTNKIRIKISRVITGLISMVAFYLLLDLGYYAIVGGKQSIIVLFLYSIRYATIGCWITAGVPFLFLKLKIN